MQTPQEIQSLLKKQNEFELETLLKLWPLWARDNQLPPNGRWRTWALMGGRGAGKTRAGAEWIRDIATKNGFFLGDAGGRIALIGETFQDVRSVMIEGESGLLSVHRRDERPEWIASRRLLKWPTGVTGHVFSASDPDALRGSQFGAVWSDEIAKWPHLGMTWDMLQFCMRLGKFPSPNSHQQSLQNQISCLTTLHSPANYFAREQVNYND